MPSEASSRYSVRAIAIKKAGVILTALVPAHQVQTHLFDQHDRERSQKLMAAIDAINTAVGLWDDTLCGCGIDDHAGLCGVHDAHRGIRRGGRNW